MKDERVGIFERFDGVRIGKYEAEEEWVIQPGQGRPDIVFCPCCGNRFTSFRAAQIMAEKLFPTRLN